ncbi:unnamed protein product [Rhizoctonia solani]|uniref:Uncharacterized protein n=1 Tax=Rhizoctonia solani TaxID=456999 RepID=A0A8H3AXA9_9AGAM|nr:unnamed protein product [Rhizoctonia solani]
MPKASKPKPTTQPKSAKSALSSAAKAAQRERTTAYKNAKASAVASTLKHKKARYYEEDSDGNGNASGNGNDGEDDEENKEDEEDEEDKEDKEDEGEGNEEIAPEPRYEPYKSQSGKYIHIPDEQGEYTRFRMLDRPEGKLKDIPVLLQLEGDGNKDLLHSIRSTVRTVSQHVSRNIPNCTWDKLGEEGQASIIVQVRKKHQYLARFRRGWIIKEMVIRALTNTRDLAAQKKKAGGQAGWSAQLKDKREAKKSHQNNSTKSKGKGKAQSDPDPSSATDQGEGLSKTSNKARGSPPPPPDESGDEVETTLAPKPSTSKTIQRVQDSEDESDSGNEKAPVGFG